MKDLAMHILDIAGNSVRAGAGEVEITLNFGEEILDFTIRDNGCGMDEEMLKQVTDPFVTSRTTRKVGLGLPFLKMNAQQSGGSLRVESEPGKGTTVSAQFRSKHIDCIPNGELHAVLALLITGNPGVNFKIKISNGEHFFELSTVQLKEILDGFPVSHPKVSVFVKEMIQENLAEII